MKTKSNEVPGRARPSILRKARMSSIVQTLFNALSAIFYCFGRKHAPHLTLGLGPFNFSHHTLNFFLSSQVTMGTLNLLEGSLGFMGQVLCVQKFYFGQLSILSFKVLFFLLFSFFFFFYVPLSNSCFPPNLQNIFLIHEYFENPQESFEDQEYILNP